MRKYPVVAGKGEIRHNGQLMGYFVNWSFDEKLPDDVKSVELSPLQTGDLVYQEPVEIELKIGAVKILSTGLPEE